MPVDVELDQLKVALETSPTARFIFNPDGRLIFANGFGADYFLYRPLEMDELEFSDLFPEHERDKRHEYFIQVVAGTAKSRTLEDGSEVSAMRKDGSEFLAVIGLNYLNTNKGNCVVVSVNDVTERIRAEERYKLAILQSPLGIMILGSQGEIIISNPAINSMFGYDETELTTLNIDVLLPVAIQENLPVMKGGYASETEAQQMWEKGEVLGRRKNGEEFPVELAMNTLKLSTGNEFIIQVQDISKRKKLEEQQKEFDDNLQNTQKLESLGVMAAGVAHDFNNILTLIIGNAELALMDLPSSSRISNYMHKILQSSQQAADLCDQMLSFSGGGSMVHEVFDLNEVIRTTTSMIEISLASHAALDISLMEDLPAVYGDSVQMRQVVLNLIINASEAISEENGNIRISSGVMDYDPQEKPGLAANEEDLPPGTYVYFSVKDNGMGMDEETKKRMFDPFYTTKFTGRGLGLAATIGIVRNHQGSIYFVSEQGSGTEFKILLPFHNDQEPKDEIIFPGIDVGGDILVIDDERLVHEIVGKTMEKAGVPVLHAYDGREGLRLYVENRNKVAMILLDLTMPYMTGDEVLKKIREIDSQLPVLIISGYEEEIVMNQFKGQKIEDFILKPLRPDVLIDKISKILKKR